MGRLFGTDVDDPLPWSRMGTTIGGAIGGGYLGSQVPGPPVIKGIGAAVGSVIGTGVGAAAPETTLSWLESVGLLEPGTRDKLGLSAEKLTTVVEGEALLDIATLGGVSIARLGGRGVVGIMTGANATTRGLAETATREGIAMLPVQVGEGKFARGFVSVMGRFPWVASGLKDRANVAMDQIGRAFDGIPARLGPVASMDQVSASIMHDATATAEAISQHFTGEFNTLLARADMMGVHVRPVNTRSVSDQLIREVTREVPVGVTGTRLGVNKNLQDFTRFLSRTTRLLSEGTQIADQSYRQMDTLLQTIDEQVVKYAPGGDTKILGRLERVRQAVQMDMLTNATERGTSTPNSRAIVTQLRALDEAQTYTVNQVLQSVTARRLGAVSSPTMRSVRFTDLGTRGMDNLAQVVLKGDNPAVIAELQHLVTPQTMGQLGNAVFNRALDDSLIEVGNNVRRFDAQDFAKSLGLNAPRSSKYRQTEALVNAVGGLRMEELNTLVQIATRASEAEIPDTATFIARKATFDGLKGTLRNALPWAAMTTAVGGGHLAGGLTGGLVTGAIALGGTRMLSNMISNPRSARALRMVMNEEADWAVRKVAWMRATSYAVNNMIGNGTLNQDQAENLSHNLATFIGGIDAERRRQ